MSEPIVFELMIRQAIARWAPYSQWIYIEGPRRRECIQYAQDKGWTKHITSSPDSLAMVLTTKGKEYFRLVELVGLPKAQETHND